MVALLRGGSALAGGRPARYTQGASPAARRHPTWIKSGGHGSGDPMQRITDEAELDRLNLGHKTAVLFTASWCPFCRRYQPVFEQEARSLQGRDGAEVWLEDEENPMWRKFRI